LLHPGCHPDHTGRSPDPYRTCLQRRSRPKPVGPRGGPVSQARWTPPCQHEHVCPFVPGRRGSPRREPGPAPGTMHFLVRWGLPDIPGPALRLPFFFFHPALSARRECCHGSISAHRQFRLSAVPGGNRQGGLFWSDERSPFLPHEPICRNRNAARPGTGHRNRAGAKRPHSRLDDSPGACGSNPIDCQAITNHPRAIYGESRDILTHPGTPSALPESSIF